MNELAVSTSNILNSIEPALTKLSETFCVSVDYLKANAMQYILKFGKYQLMENIFDNIFWISLISTGVILLVIGIGYLIYDEYYYGDEVYPLRKILKISIIIVISIIAISSIFNILLYVSSPEIYSIKQLLKLLQ